MKHSIQNGFSNEPGAGEAEATLRLIARLPAPEGLEDRVHAVLRASQDTAAHTGRVLAWPAASSPSGGWLRAAAAAAIVFVVAGGGWGIYAHVQPGRPAQGIAGPRFAGPGSFTEGGAVRRPQTLVGPTVTPPTVTAPATVATPGSNASAIPAATPVHRAKSMAVNKTAPLPAAPVQ